MHSKHERSVGMCSQRTYSGVDPQPFLDIGMHEIVSFIIVCNVSPHASNRSQKGGSRKNGKMDRRNHRTCMRKQVKYRDSKHIYLDHMRAAGLAEKTNDSDKKGSMEQRKQTKTETNAANVLYLSQSFKISRLSAHIGEVH